MHTFNLESCLKLNILKTEFQASFIMLKFTAFLCNITFLEIFHYENNYV